MMDFMGSRCKLLGEEPVYQCPQDQGCCCSDVTLHQPMGDFLPFHAGFKTEKVSQLSPTEVKSPHASVKRLHAAQRCISSPSPGKAALQANQFLARKTGWAQSVALTIAIFKGCVISGQLPSAICYGRRHLAIAISPNKEKHVSKLICIWGREYTIWGRGNYAGTLPRWTKTNPMACSNGYILSIRWPSLVATF